MAVSISASASEHITLHSTKTIIREDEDEQAKAVSRQLRPAQTRRSTIHATAIVLGMYMRVHDPEAVAI